MEYFDSKIDLSSAANRLFSGKVTSRICCRKQKRNQIKTASEKVIIEGNREKKNENMTNIKKIRKTRKTKQTKGLRRKKDKKDKIANEKVIIEGNVKEN